MVAFEGDNCIVNFTITKTKRPQSEKDRDG